VSAARRASMAGSARGWLVTGMTEHRLLDVSLDPIPAVEAYKPGIDRTLLRENLRLTTTQRAEKMIAALRLATEIRKSTVKPSAP